MSETYAVEITTGRVYDLISDAVKKGWIQVAVPQDSPASAAICKAFGLRRVDMTFTTFIDEVATRAAFVLLDLIKELKHERHKRLVRIGFSGGHTMRKIFQKLSELLKMPSDALPEKLSFHALVAGFDVYAPGSDPTSFFTYLADDPAVKTQFYLLHAPPIIPPDQRPATLGLPAVKTAYEAAKDLDILVTSAAVFAHEHSQLKKYYAEHSPATLRRLERDDCIGDMLWQPLNHSGPINTSGYPYCALSLVELPEFPDRIEDDSQSILLVVGRCASQGVKCDASKVQVLDAILHFPRKYLTHLVIDHQTAQELLERNPVARAASK